MKATWDNFIELLKDYDLNTIIELLRQIEWHNLLVSPWLWAAVIPFLALVIWKKRISLLILAVSFVLFVWLLQNSLPPPGETIPLNSLLEFIGGTVVLLGVNMYFLLIREK